MGDGFDPLHLDHRLHVEVGGDLGNVLEYVVDVQDFETLLEKESFNVTGHIIRVLVAFNETGERAFVEGVEVAELFGALQELL